MFWDDRQTQEKYFNFFKQLFKFDKKMKLIEVDFSKPWWFLLWQQKEVVALNMLNVFLYSIIASLAPLLLAQIFITGNISNLIWLILGLVIVKIVNYILFFYDPILRLQSAKSIENSATKYFLTVDPVHHSLRSSGQILSKVARGSGGIDLLIDIISFNLLSLFGMIIGLTIAFWQVSVVLALIALVFMISIVLFSIAMFIVRSKLLRKVRIENEDKSKALNLETLQQVSYIRAVFGTKEQLAKVDRFQFKAMYTSAIVWEFGGTVVTLSQILFLFSMIVIGFILLTQINLDKTIAVSLLLSYYQIQAQISFVGNSFGRAINSLEDINDLYDFIRRFGKQSYPVLEPAKN